MHADAEATVKIPLCCGVSERCRLHGLKWGEQLLRLCYVHKCQLLTVTATSCVTAQQQQQQQQRRRRKKMIRQTRAQVVNPALLLHAISRWRLLPFTGHKYFVGKAKAVVTTRLYVSTSTRRRTTAIRRRTTVERLSNRSRMGVERRASNRSRIETESPA